LSKHASTGVHAAKHPSSILAEHSSAGVGTKQAPTAIRLTKEAAPGVLPK